MAIFYLVRHGKPDYSYGDTHGFIGHGHDLAPLKKENIDEVEKMADDERLKDADIIISSPYTRALQTASIISRKTGIKIVVEPDVMEWQPDFTYQYKNVQEMKEYYQDYKDNNGIYPSGEKRNWESKELLKKRVMSVVDRYKDKYNKIILVAHKMAIKSISNCENIEPAEIFEMKI